jgi:hypothetical protein
MTMIEAWAKANPGNCSHLRETFGPEFMGWLTYYGETANFFVAWDPADMTRQWAFLLSLGYAYRSGKGQEK